MSSANQFGLQSANWPALWVDILGILGWMNSYATTCFPTLQLDNPLARSDFWSKDNSLTLREYLEFLEDGDFVGREAKLNAIAGQTLDFCLHACPTELEGREGYLIQVLPINAAVESKASGSGVQPRSTANSIALLEISHAEEGAEALQGLNREQSAAALKQKLDCALQLTRAVTLDFNNALTSILGHTSLILSKMNPDDPWRKSLLEVEKSAARAAEIASDLASFSRQEKETKTADKGVNLNDLIRESMEMFQSTRASEINWVLELEEHVFETRFDTAKMQRAIINLLDNAVEAVQSSGNPNGKITIRTENHQLELAVWEGSTAIKPGSYVSFEILDEGGGVPMDVMNRIFEPFFTTKPKQNHRGLGLAWVYGVVTNSGGNVAFNNKGLGLSAKVFLPAQKNMMSNVSHKMEDLRGNQLILMVDDDFLLLNMGEVVLGEYGYEVKTAANGEEALKTLKELDFKVDLVITDMVMPKMTGRELIERLKKVAPHLPILCTSGYHRPVTAKEETMYLRKPFTSQELVRKVKQLFAANHLK
jgi:signal transduction histidine kinase